jgi:hypothetical protein
MDIRDLAFVYAAMPAKANAGPWDWEAAYELPNFGIASAFAAVASWLAAKFTRPTVLALRAAHA